MVCGWNHIVYMASQQGSDNTWARLMITVQCLGTLLSITNFVFNELIAAENVKLVALFTVGPVCGLLTLLKYQELTWLKWEVTAHEAANPIYRRVTRVCPLILTTLKGSLYLYLAEVYWQYIIVHTLYIIVGNAGFETGSNIVSAAAYIHMASRLYILQYWPIMWCLRSRIKLAYQTHYVGDLRWSTYIYYNTYYTLCYLV